MPEAIAATVVKMFALTGKFATVVKAGVELAVIVAASAAIKQNSEVKQQGGLIDLQLNSAAPRQLVIGKRMTGGVLVDWYLAGANNTKLYLPIYLSEGPCGQVTKVFADGRLVWSTPLVHGVRTTIPDFRSGGDRLWLTYYDGRVGQAADATLVALGQGWTTNNKMTGCAWVLVECQWDSDNMRSPPNLSFEMEGAKLYDRRKDTTAGGSGLHRIDNPATWEFSDNPAVALDHFLLGRYWSGARTFGIGLSADEVPYSYFAAQANICDENVTLKAGGTQKRYRANGFIFASEDYATVISRLCTAMAARPADFGGRFGVVGSESRTPVLTIDDADVISGISEIYSPKRSWSELVGAVEGRFQDPAQLYQPTPYPTVSDAAWEAEDGGEPKVLTLDLEMETDVERAQRLATLKARAERRQATLRGMYPMWALELERGDWFTRTGAKWGVGGKTFEVIERVLDTQAWTVSIVAQEVDPADSAWDETTAQDGPGAPAAPTGTLSTVPAPSLTVTNNPIVGAASNTPAIKVAFTNPTDPRVNSIFIEVFRNSDGLKVATVPATIPDDDEQIIIQNGIADGVLYDVRAKFLTPGLSSAWSTTVSATTGATYATGSATSVPWSGVTDSGGKPDDNADVTAANTAAAIAGQGALATQSQVNLGASGRVYREDATTRLTDAAAVTSLGTAAAISGQGALATASQVNLGASGRVYRDDGVTRLTDAAAVTSLGTAAAIAGQGALATLGQVNLGVSGRVYRDDGTTRLTDAIAVTSLGTAAAIAGQGWGATASQAAADNNYTLVPGANAARYSALEAGGVIGWAILNGGFGGSPVVSRKTSGVSSALRPGLNFNNTSGTNGQIYYGAFGNDAATMNFILPVKSGDRVQVAARVLELTGSATGVLIRARQYDTAGAAVGELSPTAGLTAPASVTGAGRVGCLATASADGFVGIILYCQKASATTAAGGCTVDEMFISKARSGQVDVDPYTPGPDSQAGADITINNTAAAITGQGALATLGQVNLGASGRVYREDAVTRLTDAAAVTSLGTAAAISGQGALATLSQVNLGASGRVYRDDGVTRLTDALAVTSLGTAAAITGQGALATLGQVNLGASGRVYRDDGITRLTDALAVTSLGTAASITGQGALATLGQVNLGVSGRVYRDDGVTRLTDALAVTSLGTAAAISGQGALATLGQVNLGASGRVYRDDGVTRLTDALAVTSLGTAAAIAGQGWGATASEDAARATRGRGLVKNSNFETPFTGSAVPPLWSEWSWGSSATFIDKPIGDGKCVQLVGQAGLSVGIVQNVAVGASQDYLISATIRRQSGTLAGAGVHCQFYNASNVAIGPNNITFATEATTAGITSSTPDGVQRWEKIVTAPAGATYCLIYAMSHWEGHGSIADANSIAWYECDITPMQLVRQLRADVTLINTAAAITGQGDLATTNKSALPFGVNALINTEFALSTSYPPHGYYSGGVGNLAGVTQSASIVTAGPRRAIKSLMSGTVSSGTYFDLAYGPYADPASARRFSLPVVDGDIVGASALVAKNAAVSNIYVNIQWLNDSGIYLGENAGTAITASADGDTGNPANYSLSSVVATAPTNARFANIFVRCLTSAGAVNPTGWAMSPMLCRLPAGQAVVPPYSPGSVDRVADQTSSNTAAAITGQGSQATANATRGNTASKPASPPNYSWYSNTQTGKLELYIPGTGWVDVATLNSPLTITRTNGFVKTKIGAGTNTSDSVSFSTSGGSGSGYTYAHELVLTYTTNPTPTISSSSGSPITVSATGGVVGDEARGFVVTTVTDSLGGKAQLISPVALFWEA